MGPRPDTARTTERRWLSVRARSFLQRTPAASQRAVDEQIGAGDAGGWGHRDTAAARCQVNKPTI